MGRLVLGKRLGDSSLTADGNTECGVQALLRVIEVEESVQVLF